MKKLIADESDFKRNHLEQTHHRSQRDVFFIWMLIMFISVLGAHFMLNFMGGSPTGFVTAAESPTDNAILLLGAFLVLFVVIMIVGLIHIGITKRDY